MCMKYLNTTSSCYTDFSLNVGGEDLKICGRSIDTFKAQKDDVKGIYSIGTFVIQTSIAYLGTNNPDKKEENALESGGKVEFVIRITKCDREEVNRHFVDVDTFVIDFKEEIKAERVKQACFKFYEAERNTIIPGLQDKNLQGKYVIKVLVKRLDNKDAKQTIQSLSAFEII